MYEKKKGGRENLAIDVPFIFFIVAGCQLRGMSFGPSLYQC